ncbi:hypothetical protein GCM10010919_04380 [Alishewanella longhuensis]|uniref:Uncharacterized protein n=1 Tax=Alishewanella longhuensis TaxID=1091037 RepID=A0ABQ3KTR2_9ALTE|nr:hypothetical protein [Alishewanella longhuensis]GHG60713.1 hypothetical protein GCM10010919_04380 [Alishewanella longhuensis]
MTQILLARPHPFIVSEMVPFLQQNKIQAQKLEQLSELDTKLNQSKAAVISLALSSPLAATAEEVLAAIKQRAPRMPLVFASMLPLERVQKQLLQILQPYFNSPVLLAVDTRVGVAEPTSTNTVLYFSKADLADMQKRNTFAKLLHGHAR